MLTATMKQSDSERETEIRLECLRLASVCYSADVVAGAQKMYEWVVSKNQQSVSYLNTGIGSGGGGGSVR